MYGIIINKFNVIKGDQNDKVWCMINALNNNYKDSYYDFEKEIIKFIESYMGTLCKDKYYLHLCLVKENLTTDG